ncbi:hypothetical protein FGO68_gene7486 [Halteria grandinella]|uniref:Uncharacterized protein n=1 Tax=Halteria grandinella TaxID=5974 RepID=A0A8J8NE99_HALGN|nr:hypothetical protein FGO68_gene7486 [Halteria grandinella]
MQPPANTIPYSVLEAQQQSKIQRQLRESRVKSLQQETEWVLSNENTSDGADHSLMQKLQSAEEVSLSRDMKPLEVEIVNPSPQENLLFCIIPAQQSSIPLKISKLIKLQPAVSQDAGVLSIIVMYQIPEIYCTRRRFLVNGKEFAPGVVIFKADTKFPKEFKTINTSFASRKLQVTPTQISSLGVTAIQHIHLPFMLRTDQNIMLGHPPEYMYEAMKGQYPVASKLNQFTRREFPSVKPPTPIVDPIVVI